MRTKLFLVLITVLLFVSLVGCSEAPAGDVNEAPVADAGSAITLKIGETVNLNGSASTDPDGDTISYVWSFSSKAAGSSATISGVTNVSASFVADKEGEYVVSLIVNDGDLDSEESTVIITVNLYDPDLTVNSVSGNTNAVLQGDSIEITSSVSNIWKGISGAFSVGYYLSTDATITTGDTFIGSVSFASLASNEAATSVSNIVIPESTIADNYYIGAIVDYQGVISELSEANNSASSSSQITVTAKTINMKVSSLSIATATSGATISVPYSITNTGNTATGNFRVGVYISEDSTVTTGDTLIGNTTISISAEGNATGNISSTIPYRTSKKDYYIGVIVDDQDGVTETDENDNIATTATAVTPQKVDWVVMVYIAADNTLSAAALDDINEIKATSLNGEKIRVLTLIDQEGANNTYLYEVFSGETRQLASTELGLNATGTGELDTGDSVTLAKFIQFGTNNYAATNYQLVIWNHGGGWRTVTPQSFKGLVSTKGGILRVSPATATTTLTKDIAWDDTSGTHLANNDVQTVLANKGINLLSMDACLMGMIETAYEMRKDVTGIDFLTFSEELEPGNGYPYTAIINHYIAATDTSRANFATIVVNDYMTFYGAASDVTQSAIDLVKIEQVVADLDDFVTFLNTQTVADLITKRDSTANFEGEFVDLWDFADKFSDTSVDTLKASIEAAVLVNGHGSANANAHGLSINYPIMASDSTYIDSNNTRNVDFLGATTWDDDFVVNGPTDSHEPQDDYLGYWQIVNGYSGSAAIYNSNDADVYTLHVTGNGTIVVDLTSLPATADYDIHLYHESDLEHKVAYSWSGGNGANENMSYTTTLTGYYFLVVLRYYTCPWDSTMLSDPYDIAFSGTATY